MKKSMMGGGLVLAATLALVGCSADAGGQDSGNAESGYKIALSMSISGNDWQTTARNAITASAKMAPLTDKISALDVFVAGTDVQAQISQIQQMIVQGYQAIVMYPISPTALNPTIKQACDAGIVVFAYDATVTEPCAYNVTFDQREAGKKTAEYLADLMDNTGNVVMITGVAGTSPDTDRTEGALEVFKQRGINVLDQCAGNWAAGPSGECMSRFLAAFDQIDGVWAQAGGTAITGAFDAASRSYVPTISEGENSWRLALADPTYQAKGLRGASYASPQWDGAAALSLAVDVLDGKEVEQTTDVGFGWVTQDQVKVCETGSLEELEAGCNAFAEDLVSDTFFADWFNAKWTPGVDLAAVLAG